MQVGEEVAAGRTTTMGLGDRFRQVGGLFRHRHQEEPVAPEWEPRTVEIGNFTHSECPECQWLGPGRRSRGVAIEDAELHRLTGCGIDVPEVESRPTSARASLTN